MENYLKGEELGGDRNSRQLKLELEAKLWLGPCTSGGIDDRRGLAASVQRERGGKQDYGRDKEEAEA